MKCGGNKKEAGQYFLDLLDIENKLEYMHYKEWNGKLFFH